MTRTIHELPGGSLLIGELPEGCRLCSRGSKMVLFVTGLCDSSCYYCPLSQDKMGVDTVFADEMPVETDIDIIEEAKAIGAEGAGVSGGDPLCRLDRTLTYISLLKSVFDRDFHVHLYTSQSQVDKDTLDQLQSAGLDEIRFHPQNENWSGIERALSLDMKTGLEIPAIPGDIEGLSQVARRADEMGIDFLNINELEASETNFETLVSLGMRLTNLDSSSIDGSADTAISVLDWASRELKEITVHFCSARFKDQIQLRRRLERRLERTIRPLEIQDDDDPILILGVIRAAHGESFDDKELMLISSTLEQQFDVPEDLVNIDRQRRRIEIAPWILESLSEELKQSLLSHKQMEMGIAYEYPSWDRLQTMFEPL